MICVSYISLISLAILMDLVVPRSPSKLAPSILKRLQILDCLVKNEIIDSDSHHNKFDSWLVPCESKNSKK